MKTKTKKKLQQKKMNVRSKEATSDFHKNIFLLCFSCVFIAVGERALLECFFVVVVCFIVCVYVFHVSAKI